MSKFERDLTQGSVFKQLVLFAIPFLISNLIQSAYGVADMMILGNFSGTNSISAVNTSSQIIVIITNLATGIGVGGTVMIGQYLGANKKYLINRAISTLLITLFGLGFILGVLTIIFMHPMLTGLKVPADAYAEAQSYLLISVLGVLFIYGYNALSAIMRGMGDSKTPLIFVIVAGVTNIILDFILVGAYHQGASGAAVATIVSQGLSMLLCIIYLKKNDFQFDFRLSSFHMDKKMFATLIKVGIPSGVQHVFTNVSFLFLTAMINEFGGVAAGAAAGIVNKFNAFGLLPSVAVSSSVSAMISQSLGAKKPERVKKAMGYGFILCLSLCAIVFIIANVFPTQIYHLFGADADVLGIGVPYMHIFSFEYVFVGIIIATNAVFMATGNTWVAMVSNLITAFLVRMPVAYLLGRVMGYGVPGVAVAIPTATAVGAIIVVIYYFTGAWKKNRVELNIE